MYDITTQSPAALCLLTVAAVGAGGLLPVSPTEPILIAIGSVAPPALRLPLILLATGTAMATKTVVYAVSRGVACAIPPRYAGRLEAVRARLTGRRWSRRCFIAVSSATGVPPFYLVTAASGSLRVPLGDFVLGGTSGHALRFALLIFLPRLFGFGS
jgi:membrane protein YqaA with SNARE-associated domain